MAVKRFERWFDEHPQSVSAAVFFGCAVVLVAAFVSLGVIAEINYSTNQRQDKQQAQQIAQNRHLIAELETVRLGVCGLLKERRQSVRELKEQIVRTRRFIASHGQGIPSAGISRGDLVAELSQQEDNLKFQEGTVKTLGVVKCPKDVK